MNLLIQLIYNMDKQEVKPTEKPKARKLVLETDGININISTNEWTNLEMIAGLSMLLNKLQNNK